MILSADSRKRFRTYRIYGCQTFRLWPELASFKLPNDGRLEVREIFGIDLNASLVVLSGREIDLAFLILKQKSNNDLFAKTFLSFSPSIF